MIVDGNIINLLNSIVMVFGMVFTGCVVDNEKIVERNKPRYKTTDPSELFFKNVRTLYYDREELTDAKLEVFRIKTRPMDDDMPHLNLAIVLNWRFDEAYILIEPGAQLIGLGTLTLAWEDREGATVESKEFTIGNKDSQFALAAAVYEHILAKHHLYWIDKGKKTPLLQSKKDREAFRVTMFDFYNLVEIL